MLIMNQDKSHVLNMDIFEVISVSENDVYAWLKCSEERYIIIGTYESEARAKEVLMELFDAFNGWDDRFIMPDE